MQQCLQVLQQQAAEARQAMESAQAAANQEGKSSMGDKYETTRAMMQAERDRHARQLSVLEEEINHLHLLSNKSVQTARVADGCLVETTGGLFFLSTGLGKITVGKLEVICLSAKAPLAKVLLGAPVGGEIEFMKRHYRILAIY